MRTLKSMTEAEVAEYMRLLCAATEKVMVPDAEFVLALFGEDGKAHWIANKWNRQLPDCLRQLADQIEAGLADSN